MNPLSFVLSLGLLVALVWAAFWTVFVPETLGGQVWAGHVRLIVPVFILGCVVAGLGILLSLLKR